MTLLPVSHDVVPQPAVIPVSEIATAVVRFRDLTLSDLRETYDRAFTALRHAMADGAITPNGPPFGRYTGDPQARFDLEVGFPVEGMPTTYPSDGVTVTTGALPAARTVVMSALGSFEELPAAWSALMDFAASEGEARGDWIEVYVSDPSQTPPDQLRTDLMLPLR